MNILDSLQSHYLGRLQYLLRIRNPILDKNECKKIDEIFSPKHGSKKLRIAYIMNHARVCGGVKILLEHTNHLVEKGHQVTIVCRDIKPEWIKIKAKYIKVPPHMGFLEVIEDVDVIVCSVADQVPECYSLQKAPVILFEQGDTYIYEFDSLTELAKRYFKGLWSFPVPIVGVSNVLTETIYKNFSRKGSILHNALDERYFYPRHQVNKRKPRILFVGQENNAFKGIKDIRKALQIVRETGREFEEVWVTQQKPDSEFYGELVVNPSQKELGNIYRSSDIFISGSYYESFPLPPLEAMSCGCAVISTNNQGVQEYGIDRVNCLLGQIGNPESLAELIIELIDNPEKRCELVENGYRTAKEYRWKDIILEWEKYLYGTIEHWKEFHQSFMEPSIRIEILPNGLSREEANLRINEIQQKMDEEWCLYLIEGEVLSNESINQVKRMIASGLQSSVAFQVRYPNDISDHSIIRAEKRLFKRGDFFAPTFGNHFVVPITINRGMESYFLPLWLANLRSLYRNKRFNELINYVQSIYSKVSIVEQLVATKWLMLALLELERTEDVIKLGKEVLEIDISYSDIYYILGCACLIMKQNELSMQMFQTVKQIRSSTHCLETFEAICGFF